MFRQSGYLWSEITQRQNTVITTASRVTIFCVFCNNWLWFLFPRPPRPVSSAADCLGQRSTSRYRQTGDIVAGRELTFTRCKRELRLHRLPLGFKKTLWHCLCYRWNTACLHKLFLTITHEVHGVMTDTWQESSRSHEAASSHVNLMELSG